jgi:hypothetical protein
MAGKKPDFPLLHKILEENMDHQVHLMDSKERLMRRHNLDKYEEEMIRALRLIAEKLLQFDEEREKIDAIDESECDDEMKKYRDQNLSLENEIKAGRKAIQFNGPVGQIIMKQ